MTFIVTTIHPANVLRGSKPFTDVIRGDLQRAKRIVEQGGFESPEHFVIPHASSPLGVEETTRRAISWMQHWQRIACHVAVDIETSSLDYFNCRLNSIALCGEDGHNTAVAFTLGELHTIPWSAESALVDELRRVLKNCPLIFHNAPFDTAVLRFRGFELNSRIEDTMAMHHIVQPDIPHTLDWVGQTYLDVEPWKVNHKGEKEVFTKDVIRLLVYNARDAIVTQKLRKPLYADILDRGMSENLIYWQNEFAKLSTEMELVGLPVNMAKRKAMGQELLESIEKQKHAMREWLHWPDFNPMNKNHAIAALYDKRYAGLMPTAWTEKTQQPSTKYEHLVEYMEHPFVKLFTTCVENQHAYATQYRDAPSTKGDPKAGSYFKAIRKDGRLHPQWNPVGQKGTRQTSKPNCQNQRVKDRAFFEAPPGRVLIGADKDQLELRLAAVYAGVRELLEEMAKENGDPHRLAAINVYGEQFLKADAALQKLLRDGTKTTVYASLYRAGPRKVWQSIRKKKFLPPSLRARLTENEVRRICKAYFGKYTEIPEWHDRNYEQASTLGYNEIPPFGRRRWYPVAPPPYTEVANWGIQCSGADFVTKEMVEIQYELKRKFSDAWVILHGHDAVYIECWEKDAYKVCDAVNRLFGCTNVEGPAGSVALTAKAKIGKNLKEVK